jgi:hypothetical protein
MFFILAASLWFAEPAPIDMPRAESYHVTENGVMHLEDRYKISDLWVSKALLGRWVDEDGRIFILLKSSTEFPFDASSTLTRTGYSLLHKRPIDDNEYAISRIASMIAPKGVSEEGVSPRQEIPSLRKTLFFEGTNTSSIVCTFSEEKSKDWYFAGWSLLPEDEYEMARETFEKKFLSNWAEIKEKYLPSERRKEKDPKQKRKKVEKSEKEHLFCDAAFSVTNYPTWRVTRAGNFVVLDALPKSSGFPVVFSNELENAYVKYLGAFPGFADATNALFTVRLFSDRESYLSAVGEELAWTSAYWSVLRREIVAYLPPDGEEKLLQTCRHEAFHQYISYAAALISISPWLNEGYAQYFENEGDVMWSPKEKTPSKEELELGAAVMPELFYMDYEDFYAGTPEERSLKYRLAKSIAIFLERGAPEVRFKPYENLKKDYMSSLRSTRDMAKATKSAFGSTEKMQRFIKDWKEFWQ